MKATTTWNGLQISGSFDDYDPGDGRWTAPDGGALLTETVEVEVDSEDEYLAELDADELPHSTDPNDYAMSFRERWEGDLWSAWREELRSGGFDQ